MIPLFRAARVLAGLSFALALWTPSEAHACGGGEFWNTQVENATTTGHRVIISISTKQTVLWDQITFTGDPQDFAWVYPVKAGARVEAATDAWAESLDALTTKRIQSPFIDCQPYEPNTGCANGCTGALRGGDGSGGGGGGANNGVTVIHTGTTGPYDTVTIQSTVPGAIATWLGDHQYNVPADVSPVLDAYAADGFDFVALRLTPGQGVAQMKPVRVITPGPTTTFPMKMLQAGAAEKVAVNVMVLSEGRLQVSGFTNTEVDPNGIIWDFTSQTSNYPALRDAALAKDGGLVFLTSYALNGSVFGKTDLGESDPEPTLAETFSVAAVKNGEGTECNPTLLGQLFDWEGNTGGKNGYLVVDVCDDQGNCTDPGPNELDSRELECGKAKDLAVAMIGLHPKDVWITRLEAELPKSALVKDLVLTPVAAGGAVHGYVQATSFTGEMCADALATALPLKPSSGSKAPLPPSALGMAFAGLALAMATLRRRFGLRGRQAA